MVGDVQSCPNHMAVGHSATQTHNGWLVMVNGWWLVHGWLVMLENSMILSIGSQINILNDSELVFF